MKLESCWLKSHAKKHKVRQKSRGKNVSRGVHALCPTRWTVCGEALAEVFNNHAELANYNGTMGLVTIRVKRN